MPGIPQLVIEQSDGTVRDTLDCENASKDKSLIDMWTGSAVVDRSAWLAVKPNVDERTDVFKIEESDGTLFWAGRYVKDSRDGDTVTLTVESFERDARDAEPTNGKLLLNSVADSTVTTTHGIDAVPSLSQGIIETGDSSVSFSFAWAERGKVIRDAAEPAGMDVAFNPDQTIDFINRLGSDKSGTITVSSTNQTIVDSLSVEDKSRDPVTHVRGLGAQQGGSQVTATATIASYTAGERQVWRKYENKDIINQDRLQSIVDRLASEFDSARRRIVLDVNLINVDVSLGDSVFVDLPEDNISQALRITQLTEVIGANPHYETTLTNRDPSRGGSRKRRDDLKRFNSGDQGFIDRDNFRAIERQPVDATYNAVGDYYYPDDVVREDRAEVVVQALPYRSYVSSAGHSHNITVRHPSHSHDVTHPSHSHNVTHPSHSHNVTHPSHSHNVTHPSHSHNVTHPSHSHNVTHPSHSHGVSTTSNQRDYTDAYFTRTSQLAGSAGTTSPDTTFNSIPTGSDAFATFGGNIGSTIDGPVTVTATIYDGSTTSSTVIDTQSYDISSDGNFTFSLGASETDRSSTYLTASVNAIDSGSGTIAIYSSSVSIIGVPQHTHDVSDTSTTALGTTDTSTTALGTTETSTTALGTTEASSTELGVNETSTTALGTTEASSTELGVNETSTTALGTDEYTSSTSSAGFQPGLNEYTNETASGVDLIVNGSIVASNIGTGTFTTVVDVSGEFTQGNNTIELTSDSLGFLAAAVRTELFRSGAP